MARKRQPRTFLEHIHELRKRLFVSGVAFLVGAIVAYIERVRILSYLHQPFNQVLYYTSPAGAFNLAMKISVLGGIIFLLPVLSYNLVSFAQPALTHQFSRRGLRLISLLTILLAAGGAAFAYYCVVPMSLSFFGKFNTAGFRSLISATDYINFVINCLIAFVVIFQIPLLILLIDKIKPLPPKRLLHFERHVIVASLLIALILPFTYDPLTQFLIAAPMIALYNMSIILVIWAHHANRQHTRSAAPVHPTPVSNEGPTQQTAPPRPALRRVVISDVVAPAKRTEVTATYSQPQRRQQSTGYIQRTPIKRTMPAPLDRSRSAALISDILVSPAPRLESTAQDQALGMF